MLKSGRYVTSGALSFELNVATKTVAFQGTMLPWEAPREPHASAAFSVAWPDPAWGLGTLVLQADGATLVDGARIWRRDVPGLFTCIEGSCRYAAGTAWNLAQHVRARHTDERPFACAAAGCARRFATIMALKHHKRTHPGGAPPAEPRLHACPEPLCGYRAASVAALVRHARKAGHKGALPCPHPFCDERSNSSASLRLHLASTAHGGVGARMGKEFNEQSTSTFIFQNFPRLYRLLTFV